MFSDRNRCIVLGLVWISFSDGSSFKRALKVVQSDEWSGKFCLYFLFGCVHLLFLVTNKSIDLLQYKRLSSFLLFAECRRKLRYASKYNLFPFVHSTCNEYDKLFSNCKQKIILYTYVKARLRGNVRSLCISSFFNLSFLM